MYREIDKQLLELKGFTFDGDTGRTLRSLYQAVDTIGGTKDVPFVRPYQRQGHDRPAVVNAYLDPEGRRFHIIWYSDDAGLSHVDNVIFDAPSLAEDRRIESCDACGGGIYNILSELDKDG